MRVEYSKSFAKTVGKQSGKILESIRATIKEVQNAETIDDITDCKKLVGYEYAYRIRVGTWRVFFTYHIEVIDGLVVFQYLVPREQAYSKQIRRSLKQVDK